MIHKDKVIKIKRRRIFWLRKIKTSKGCERCGYNESPLALDFAHINPTEKHTNLSTKSAAGQGTRFAGMDVLYKRICTVDMVKNTKYIKELFDEIRKCKILCKNCHVIETAKNNEFKHFKCFQKHLKRVPWVKRNEKYIQNMLV